jgi:uncharacterized protein
MSPAQLDVARRLYDSFLAHDAEAILTQLHPQFEGIVSAGMPLGVGGIHRGPERMMADVWVPIFGAYDVRVEADELLPTGDAAVLAVGGYRGRERAAGRSFDAAFAHLLGFRDGLVGSLRQITDTASWPPPQG